MQYESLCMSMKQNKTFVLSYFKKILLYLVVAIHTRKISEISSIISFRQETVIQIHFDRIVVMNIENLFAYNLYLLFKCNNTEPLIVAFAKKSYYYYHYYY